MIYFLDLFGVFVFAISGSLAAGRKHLDLFGVIVLALATALGGGTIRDLILGAQPIFWVADPIYIYVAIIAALITIIASRTPPLTSTVLQIADAIGLAVFTVVGTQRALGFEVQPVIAIMMGVMTGVVGGMIRDMLAGEIPLILRREIYATASICGGVVYILTIHFLHMDVLSTYLAIFIVLALRLGAIHWNISLPIFHDRRKEGNRMNK